MKTLQKIGRFLFLTTAPQTAAAFRIAIATAVLLAHLTLIPDFGLLYSETGILTNEILSEHQKDYQWSLLHAVDAPAAVAFVHALLILALLALALGFFTRTSTVACFVLLASFRTSGFLFANSGDDVVMLAFF